MTGIQKHKTNVEVASSTGDTRVRESPDRTRPARRDEKNIEIRREPKGPRACGPSSTPHPYIRPTFRLGKTNKTQKAKAQMRNWRERRAETGNRKGERGTRPYTQAILVGEVVSQHNIKETSRMGRTQNQRKKNVRDRDHRSSAAL